MRMAALMKKATDKLMVESMVPYLIAIFFPYHDQRHRLEVDNKASSSFKMTMIGTSF